MADAIAEREARLADLLGRLTDEIRAGGQPDLAALAAAHPDLSAELQELWAAVMLAEGMAAGAALLPTHEGPDADWSPGALQDPTMGRPADLPRRFGEYELLDELGRGGMGVVYRAWQPSLGRTVALKMILRGDLAAAEDVARFRSEAESAGRLHHPHIVPVYEVGEIAGQPYFSMQYVEGWTLARRLAEGPMRPREAAALLAPICQAIQVAHDFGILHRDLKPSNIMIDRDGRPLVTDFGLAKRVTGDPQLTRSGAILGTPSYMAPEQAAGSRGEIGPASDVFSLGAVLYQMLTGRPPFQAATPVDTVLLLLEQDPLPPRLINPRADRDLEMIALRCLQKPPGLRYASARALGEDLQAYLADEPIAARSGLFSQVLARWFRETHHATVLENWGLLWMWHSLALLVMCLLTNWFQWRGYTSPWPYLGLWSALGGAWAAIFWALRRRAGPVTFVERQIAHIWAASMIGISLLFPVERLLGLPALQLSPVLALISGMVFLVKAGVLTGAFYLQAGVLFATALAMAWLERRGLHFGVTLFGLVSAACFFLPGLKYYRQRRRQAATEVFDAPPGADRLTIPLSTSSGDRGDPLA